MSLSDFFATRTLEAGKMTAQQAVVSGFLNVNPLAIYIMDASSKTLTSAELIPSLDGEGVSFQVAWDGSSTTTAQLPTASNLNDYLATLGLVVKDGMTFEFKVLYTAGAATNTTRMLFGLNIGITSGGSLWTGEVVRSMRLVKVQDATVAPGWILLYNN